MSPGRQEILALETLDCAKKVRIHYALPCALELAWAERLPGTLEVQAFSRLARGAKDHLTLIEAGRWHAGGVLGEPRLVVTYGKQGGDRPVEAIAAFQAALSAACGPIREVRRPEASAEPEAEPGARPSRT